MLGLLLALCSPAWAQYTTATVDAVIGSGEYGSQTDGQNQQSTNNGSTTWYMTWDATNLYIGISGADGGNAAFVYLDVNPIVPVTGGSGSNGSTQGIGYDQHNFSVLPHRADYALYLKDGSGGQQLLQADGNGGWASVANPTLATAFNNNNRIREISIPWAQLGGRPASFNWLGYLDYFNSGTPFIFGAVPTGNFSPTGTSTGSSTTLQDAFYYTVSTVTDGVTKPFSQVSYTFPGSGSVDSFGSFSAFDFTMNTAGQQISRGCSGGTWNFSGSLVVGNGSIYFGASNGASCSNGYGATSVGNVVVTGGRLDMDYTTRPLVVSNNVSVSGGTFKLGSVNGGDLRLGGNLTVSGGTLDPYSRAVFLTGSSQTLTGSSPPTAGTSSTTLSGNTLPLAYLYLSQASGGTATLGSNLSVSQILGFGTGQLVTGSYVLDLGTTGVLSSESETSNVLGYTSSMKNVGAGGGAQVDFGQMGLQLSPVNSSAALGQTVVTRSRGLAPLTGQGSSQSIQRNFRIQPAGSAGGTYDVNMDFSYFDSELNGIDESKLRFFYSANATTMRTTASGTFTYAGISSEDPNGNVATRNDLYDFGVGNAAGIVYTLGDQDNPLPVQLVAFAGTRTVGGVQLSWRTGLELHNAGFQVERQQDGGRWTALTFVPGQGTGQGRAYQYLDAAAPAGLVYYRLRQTDTDGTASYSPVVAVSGSALLGTPVLALSPIPAPADQASIAVDLSTLPAADRMLVVYDLQGRQLLRVAAAAGAASVALPVQQLAAGTYLVVSQGGGDSFHARFNKL